MKVTVVYEQDGTETDVHVAEHIAVVLKARGRAIVILRNGERKTEAHLYARVYTIRKEY